MAEVYLLPDETVTAASWGPVGAASNHLATDDPFGADDDDTTYAQGSDVAWNYLILGVQPMTDAVEITEVQMHARYNNAGSGTTQEFDFGIRIGGVNYLNGTITVVSATYTTVTKTWTTNPATGGLFTKVQLDAIQLVLGTQDTVKPFDSVRVTSARLRVTYQPLSAEIGTTRAQVSARLRRYSQEIPQAIITATPDTLDTELMDNVSLSHPAAPGHAADGLGETNWERGLFSARAVNFDPNTLAVEWTLWDQRRYLCTAWDTARTARGTSIDEQGVARLASGGTFATSRASNMWVQDCESRLVVAKGIDARGYDFAGTLADAAATRYGAAVIESASTNYLKWSSAVEGSTAVAGITVTGAAGTFTFEASTVQPLFDASVSGNNYIFTAGSPHSADKRATWPVTASILANTLARFSIDYMNTGTVSADRLCWRLQRAVDSNYWNDSTGAWGAGAVDNPLTLAATRTRAKSKVINVGGTNTTVTLTLAALSGGTALRVDRVYHVQLEDRAWATSRIVTGTATYQRASQLDTVTNVSGARSINSAGGTFLCRLIPEWAAADVTSSGLSLRIFDVTFDASNWMRLYYDGTNLSLSIRASGVTTIATKAWTAVAGAEAHIGARWTSADGEHGLVRTHDVYLNGVKGTSATRAADPTRSAVALHLGCDSTGNQANGHLFEREFLQVVLTDDEIAAEV